jgi:hypothetical protein
MEIIGKIEVKGYLSCEDLDNGEVFTFLDDNKPCMLCADNYDTYIVDLDSGAIEGVICDFSERPIRKLKAKLIIED